MPSLPALAQQSSPNLPPKGRWVQGPQMTFSGKKHQVQIFHIPQGEHYLNYKIARGNFSKGASYSVTYVTANSTSSIDELQSMRSGKQMDAALKAQGLQAVALDAGAGAARAAHQTEAGNFAQTHSHAAIIVTGDTKYQYCGSARLDISVEILLEATVPTLVSRAPPPLPSSSNPVAMPLASPPQGSLSPKPAELLPSSAPRHPPVSSPAKKPLQRQSSVPLDPTIPPETACPLIARKLDNPRLDLTLEESIELLITCVRYGKQRAQKLQGQDAVIVIGNTGAGKSTLVNYLSGCTMQLKTPKELGLKGIKKIVVVQPPTEGGTVQEIMPIGHTKESKTFMPQIETDPDQKFTYCDCPGFLDNRGAEINIANAVNVRSAITEAQSVKVIVLINYHSLLADRGRGLSDMLTICSNLFGHTANLETHKASLLLGITQAPLEMDLSALKEWIVEDTPDIMKTLAERLFLFDPLNRPLEGGWDRATCLTQLASLSPIENPSAIFKTVLTDTDEKKLLAICEQMGDTIHEALKQKNFPLAASRFRHLEYLSLIEHITVERLLSQSLRRIEQHFQKTLDDFKTHCNFEHFSAAETLLQELKAALESFGEVLEEVISLEALAAYHQESETRYQERLQKEHRAQEQLKQAQGRIEELLRLLEEQKQSTQRYLTSQEQKHEQMRREMETRMESIQASYTQMQQELRREMETRLSQKEEELRIAQGLSQQELQAELAKEKERLAADYRQKQEAAEIEKQKLLAEQEAQKRQREQDMAAEKARLQERLRAIETQQTQKVQELQAGTLPSIAFGKADWEKYFGNIGAEPPLPSSIGEILKSACPYWPTRRVEDTHMLVLIPQSVNGTPLTLKTLGEMIKRPHGGGHPTKYHNEENSTLKELGNQGSPHSYWALMTKDVIPDSRSKTFSEQQALLKTSYAVPGTLEAATMILMHHAKGGEKLYTDNPDTYTRCQEKVVDNKHRVVVGSFGSSGLFVDFYNGDGRFDNRGLGGLRKF